jgi:tRNA U34 5-methylaminomethyl-2-thiouridine-forming methyltransferase MnmC
MNDDARTLLLTEDGSHTVSVPGMNVTYHSRHGAIQESLHVFLDAGLNFVRQYFSERPISILEIGFGTGLNAFLTAIEAEKECLQINFTSLESNPLEVATAAALNYPNQLGYQELFDVIQRSHWNERCSINEHFSLRKVETKLADFISDEQYRLVYFDAFAPEAQPELWTEEVFRQIGAWMYPGGALVTYCSKSNVRRAMQAAGWTVTKIPGPRGKREMVRACFGYPSTTLSDRKASTGR